MTFGHDVVPPSNPTSATEINGAADDAWQNAVSDPNFTWSGASDLPSGVKGYYWYFGTDPAGSPTTWTTSAGANPPAVGSSGVYYLRVKTEDNAGNQSAPVTLFIFRYDATAPLNPTVSDLKGALSGVWQSTHPDPYFTWSDPADPSGIGAYHTCWGTSITGAPAISISASPIITTVAPATRTVHYLRMNTTDGAGNTSADEALFTFKVTTQASCLTEC